MTTGVPEPLPVEVAINAWRGRTPVSPLAGRADRWGARGAPAHAAQALALGGPVDPTKWADPRVGFGVLLPDDPTVPDAIKAVGGDAPEPVRELLAARPGSVVLRWPPAHPQLRKLRRYYTDRGPQDNQIGLSRFGTGVDELPRYILIVADPETIPWQVQYDLQSVHYVGRLALDAEGLGRYLDALIHGFPEAGIDVRAPLLWAVAQPGDITAEMRAVIAEPLAAKLTDPQLERFRYVTDAAATGTELLTRLTSDRPGLVVTSSHGLIEGSDDALRGTLGLPVDAAHTAVGLSDIVEALPGGAVWYAQACCSAGSEGVTKYGGLLEPGAVLETVEAAASVGSMVAPAVTGLLGRANPVRAVMGHVEPTFDWTLRDQYTGQGFGDQVVAALSDNLYAGQPIGYAFDDYRARVGVLSNQWLNTFHRLEDSETWVRASLTRLRLTCLDRQSLVLLGCPTVTMPDLATAP